MPGVSTMANSTAMMDTPTTMGITTMMDNTPMMENSTMMDNTTLMDNTTMMDNATMMDNTTLMDNATMADIITSTIMDTSTTVMDMTSTMMDMTTSMMATTGMANWTSSSSSISSSSLSSSSSGWDNLTTTVKAPEERTTADMVVLICSPIVVLLGTTGNALCLIIMMRRHYRACSTGVYLFCLALADTMFLFMNSMVMNFTRLTFDFDFRVVSVATCKIYIYLLMTSKCLSAWLIVAVTVERLLAVSFPLKAHVLATRRRAWLVVVGLVVVICGVYLFPVFTYTHIDKGLWTSCDMAQEHKDLHRDIVLKFLDLILHTLLPALTLFVCNIMLMRALIRSRQLLMTLGHMPSLITGGSPVRRQGSAPSRLTAMLFLLSGVFLLLNLPMALYLLAAAIFPNMPDTFDHWELLYRIFYTLQISNSATNFPLYCLSGPLFRRQVAALCRCCPCCSYVDPRRSYQLVSFRSGATPSHSFKYEPGPRARRSRAVGGGHDGAARDHPGGNTKGRNGVAERRETLT